MYLFQSLNNIQCLSLCQYRVFEAYDENRGMPTTPGTAFVAEASSSRALHRDVVPEDHLNLSHVAAGKLVLITDLHVPPSQ